jgi:hypothetical protein
MRRYYFMGVMLLGFLPLGAAWADDGLSADFTAGVSNEHYQSKLSSGNVTTQTYAFASSWGWHDFSLYGEVPFERVNYNVTGVIYTPGHRTRGRPFTPIKGRTVNGLADATTGLSYTINFGEENNTETAADNSPSAQAENSVASAAENNNDDAVMVAENDNDDASDDKGTGNGVWLRPDVHIKWDNGAEKENLGSGTRDVSAELAAGWDSEYFGVSVTLGHTNVGKEAGVPRAQQPNDYNYGSASVRVTPFSPLDIELVYSNQSTLSAENAKLKAPTAQVVPSSATLELSFTYHTPIKALSLGLYDIGYPKDPGLPKNEVGGSVIYSLK